MFTMLIISLIVLGFATISRREQRQSLDQQLSAQAFYAAESGIEDAKDAIKTYLTTNAGQPVPGRGQCATNDLGVSIYPQGARMKIDAANGVSYTCLKVNPSPNSLQYDGVLNNSLVIPIKTTDVTRSVEVRWRPRSPIGAPANCPSPPSGNNVFSPQSGAGAWTCSYGLLRLDLVPTDDTATPNALAGRQLGAYFVPSNSAGGGVLAYSGANLGHANVVQANCIIVRYAECWARIDGLNTTSFALKVSSLYRPGDLTIRAFPGANGSGPALNINGVQAVIDTTGKATDVLRRIQVRLPLTDTSSLMPSAAIVSTDSICKRFAVTPTTFSIPGDIADPDPNNPMCAVH